MFEELESRLMLDGAPPIPPNPAAIQLQQDNERAMLLVAACSATVLPNQYGLQLTSTVSDPALALQARTDLLNELQAIASRNATMTAAINNVENSNVLLQPFMKIAVGLQYGDQAQQDYNRLQEVTGQINDLTYRFSLPPVPLAQIPLFASVDAAFIAIAV